MTMVDKRHFPFVTVENLERSVLVHLSFKPSTLTHTVRGTNKFFSYHPIFQLLILFFFDNFFNASVFHFSLFSHSPPPPSPLWLLRSISQCVTILINQFSVCANEHIAAAAAAHTHHASVFIHH